MDLNICLGFPSYVGKQSMCVRARKAKKKLGGGRDGKKTFLCPVLRRRSREREKEKKIGMDNLARKKKSWRRLRPNVYKDLRRTIFPGKAK